MAEFIFVGVIVLIFFAFLLFQKKKTAASEAEKCRINWGKSKPGTYYNFHLIGKYFQKAVLAPKQYHQVVSDRIKDDLDLNNIFRFIDRTTSCIGKQFLYYKLRAINNDPEKLKKANQLTEIFTNEAEVRNKAQLLLTNLQKQNGYYFTELLFDMEVKRPKWLPLVYALTFASVFLLGFAILYPGLLIWFIPVFIANLVVHYWNKRNIGYYSNGLQEYLKTYKVAAKLSEIPEIGSHFPVKEFLGRLAPLNRKMWFISLNNTFEADATAIFYSIFELLKISLNLEVLTFFSLIKKTRQETRSMHQLFEFIGETDYALSVASLRYGLNEWCLPVFGPAGSLNVQSVIHPLIPDCVPNDLQLKAKSLLLTGSNMSGKTTFIRTVAINMLLGQTIYTCMARYFQAPFSKVFSSIRISDDLLQEKSYYLEEVTIIKEFIEEARKPEPCLLVLDEIFKGTNTIERIAAGKAILSYLAKANHLVFVSTHDIELTELLQNHYDLYHFSESIQDSQLLFDHKIKQGPLKTRNAIRILELNNYPAEIIAEAGKAVTELEKMTRDN